MDNETTAVDTTVATETVSETVTENETVSDDTSASTGSIDFGAYTDGSFNELYPEEIIAHGGYHVVLSEMHRLECLGYKEIQKQTEMLTEINENYANALERLDNIYTMSVYILAFFIIYVVGKLLSSTLFRT